MLKLNKATTEFLIQRFYTDRCKEQLVKVFFLNCRFGRNLEPAATIGFPKWDRLVGSDNLGKMAKNCMRITKWGLRGGNSGGTSQFFG